jgi:tetratricopeptide (TPR) repeat protein
MESEKNVSFVNFKSKLSNEFKRPRVFTCRPNYNNLCLYSNFIHDYEIPESISLVKTTYLDLRSIQDADWAVFIVSQGLESAIANDYETAIKKYDSALDLDPDSVHALIAKGTALANTRKYEEAIKNFKKALNLNPKHAKAQEYLLKTRDFYNNLICERESAYTGEFLLSNQDSQSLLQLSNNDLFL